MDLRVTLAPDGGLRLILPTNRHLDVGNTPSALGFIQRILRDAATKPPRGQEKPGYVAEFPTQHVIDIWKRQDEARQQAASKDRLKEMGIDLEALDISL